MSSNKLFPGKSAILSTTLTSVFLLLSLFAMPVKAQESKPEQRRIEQQAIRKTNQELRCTKATEHLNQLTENYTRNKTKLTEISEKSILNITTLINRAKEKGRDTSLVESSLLVYKDKIQNANAEFEKLILLVNSAKEYSCIDSPKEYKASLEAIRAQLRVTNASMQTVKTYFSRTLKVLASSMPKSQNQ